MENTSYTVKTQVFEGPLDLLLTLIEKRKLLINDIALSHVADDYIAYVKNLGGFPVAEGAQFILIASTLLLIKSKSLLPTLNLTDEEEMSVSDLENRLKLYKRIKDLNLHVKERFGKNIIFELNTNKTVQPVFSPDDSMKVPALLESIRNLIANLPKKEFLPKAVLKKVISLEEMIGSLTERIKTSMKTSFKEFTNMGKGEKVHVIVGFLAMLELVKQGTIMVSQDNHFDDISIETNSVDVPRYS